jgi:hypothetical protein
VTELLSLAVADEPAAWAAIGFAVADGRVRVGGVEIELVGRGRGTGIVGWTLTGDLEADIDGLPTVSGAPADGERVEHPNGALALDHVVVLTPDFERTRSALAEAGFDLRAERDMRGTRMAFYRLGPTILELVAEPGGDATGPARFWGLVAVLPSVDDVDPALAAHLGEPRDAVQPGRRIATLSRDAGISPALAFMTPRRSGR